MIDTDFQRTDTLQQCLLQIGTDAHNLAGGLHLGAQLIGSGSKFVKGKPGQLGNHIVQTRRKGGVGVGDLDFLQRHSHGDFGRDPGNGITGSLGSQRRRPGNPGIDLNEIVFGGIGVQGELDVAAALDSQFPDDLDGSVIQHLQVVVVQGHDGRNHNGVAGVNAHRIHVFHTADGDGVVIGVPHDLKFNFLVALDGFFDQNLMDGRELERIQRDFLQLRFIVGKAAARTAQRKGRAQHHGIADTRGSRSGLLHGIGYLGGNDRLSDGLAQLLEQLPVLCLLDGAAGGAQELDTALLQNSLSFQLHGQIQSRLAADTGDDGVGALIADDFGHIFQRQRLHVHLVRNRRVGHDGSRIGIHQHDLIPLLLQRQTGLRAGVVKFGSLSDDNGAGANNHDFFQVGTLCHIVSSIFSSICGKKISGSESGNTTSETGTREAN